MMKIAALMLFLWAVQTPLSCAEDFLGAPVPPGGKVTTSSESRLEKTYDTSYEDALKFYKDAFAKEKNIKFWDRKDATYIEDHQDRPWHSVTISKLKDGKTGIVLIKDNWTWIIGTLVLRFIGVFAVLCCLYLAMSLSGAVISRLVKPGKAKK